MKTYDKKKGILKYIREHKLRKRRQKLTALFAAFAVAVTAAAMVLPALTMEVKAIECDPATHIHTESCYDGDGNVLCGYADFVVHTHNDLCCDGAGILICGLAEKSAHTHGDSCFHEKLLLVCDIEESEEHSHGGECYKVERNLICRKAEIKLHTHSSSCFDAEGSLVCGETEVKEHVHDESCLVYENDSENEATGAHDGNGGRKDGDEPDAQTGEDRLNAEADGNNKDAESKAVVWKDTDGTGKTKRSLGASNAAMESIELGQYITQVNVSKKEGGQWVSSNIFNSGDSVKVSINYEIPEQTIRDDFRKVHYQLPAGIGLAEDADGPVLMNGETVGVYSIGQDGLIEIIFSSEFADGRAFLGQLEFQGTVSTSGEGEETEIIFGEHGGSITILPEIKESDLTINKEGLYDKGKNLAGYRITVSTEKGSDGEVNIRDGFLHSPDYGTINYENVISLVKRDSEGKTTDITSKLNSKNLEVKAQTGSRAASFAITALPELSPGEAYILTYTAKPELSGIGDGNGYLSFSNKATAEDETNSVWAQVNIRVSESMVEKEYKYDEQNRTITWNIGINRDQRDISGFVLRDELKYTVNGRTKTMKLPEKVTMTVYKDNKPAGQSREISLPYKFPKGSDNQYVITYTTGMPQNIGENDSVVFHNRAELEDYWVETDTGVIVPGKHNVVKGLSKRNDDTGVMEWAALISHSGRADADRLRYVDWIADLVTGTEDVISGSHYTTARMLYESLAVQTTDGKWLAYGTDYRLYAVSKKDVDGIIKKYGIKAEEFAGLLANSDFTQIFTNSDWKDKWREISSFEENEAISMFFVLFNENVPAKIGEADILLTYNTQVDKSSIPSGYEGQLNIYNMARVPDDWDIAREKVDLYERLNKQASAVGTDKENKDTSSYTDVPLVINSSESKNILHYRIFISGYAEDDMTVTDILPAGAVLIKDSVLLLRHTNDDNSYTASSEGTGNYYVQEIAAEKNKDGTTKVTFKLGHLKDIAYEPFGIYYDVSVAEDPAWENNEEITYVNTAVWDGEEDSVSTTVKHTLPRLEKSVQQIAADEGGESVLSDVLRYYITVNPSGDKLNPYNDKLTLKDTLKIPHGSEAAFLPGSVRLYRYAPDDEKNYFCGEPIDSSEYSAEYDSETYTITFKLPDSTPCVLVYDYNIERGAAAGDIDVYNSVTLSGKEYSGSESNIVIKEEQSSSTVNKASVTLFKYESGNLTKLLPGASFELERYEENGGRYSWKQTDITASGEDGLFVTDENGTIIFNFLEEETGSLYNTLYRLKEVTAPAGYLKNDETYYFVWMEQGANEEATVEKMRERGALGDVDEEKISFIGYATQYTEYIPNEPDKLTVTKEWKNDAGEMIQQPPADSVSVQLYQWKNGSETAYGKPVALNSENGWSYTWEGLPKTDGNGKEYRYTVRENPIEGFETTYSENNENGIQFGNIGIVNTQNGFVLPETGGGGTAALTAAGLLLTCGSLIGYFLLRLKRRKYENF